MSEMKSMEEQAKDLDNAEEMMMAGASMEEAMEKTGINKIQAKQIFRRVEGKRGQAQATAQKADEKAAKREQEATQKANKVTDPPEIEKVKRALRKNASQENKTTIENIANNAGVDESVVEAILAEFKALQPDPAALAAAKQMIKERKSISTVAKETGLDEFTVGVLENEFQHSPLEGEEAEIATKMIFEGSSARDVHNATKFNQNKVSALIHALTGDVIDKVNELIRARQEDREIAKVTGLHDRTVLWLRDKYNSQPLTGADAELAKKMLNDGMGVPEIVKKAEVSISHDQLRMLFPEISGEKVEKVKEMLKAGTHEHDIHMAAGLCLEIVIYWKEELGLKKRKKLAQ